MLFHNANVLLVAATGLVILLSTALRGRPIDWSRYAICGGAIALAVAGEAGFSLAVAKMTGNPPIRPPFLTARLIADGPGTDYLRHSCPRSGFEVCRLTDQLPMESDKFLWSRGFGAAAPAAKRVMAAQDLNFAVSVVADRPVAVIASTARSILRQFGSGEMAVFNYPQFRREGFINKLPATTLKAAQSTLAWREKNADCLHPVDEHSDRDCIADDHHLRDLAPTS